MNAIDNNKQTALHWAAVRGSIAVADVLLQSGARVEAADNNGYRVIFFPFILHYLLSLGFHNSLWASKSLSYVAPIFNTALGA